MEQALLNVARRKKSLRYPLWFLRQAGRYLPEYQKIRGDHDFLSLCRNPELAAEITLQPLLRYDLDAAIIFSDILVIPFALGQQLSFVKNHGPHLSPPLLSTRDIQGLAWDKALGELTFVAEAIALVAGRIKPHQCLIGFAGAPFTVATYMIEGGSSKSYAETKRLLFNSKTAFGELIERLASLTYAYLEMQIAAGAQTVMVFDSWAGQLSSTDYRETILPHTKNLLEQLSSKVPVIYFPGQGSERLYDLASLSSDIVVAVDWRVPLHRAQKILSQDDKTTRVLQGNLEPTVLVGSEQLVRSRVRQVLQEAWQACRGQHIFNVGHGLIPEVNPEALQWVIAEVREFVAGS